jgi:hypothetical protein
MAASQYLPDFLLFSSAGLRGGWQGGGGIGGGKGKDFYSQVGADYASLGVCVFFYSIILIRQAYQK